MSKFLKDDNYGYNCEADVWEEQRQQLYEDNKNDVINIALEVARNNFAETARAKNGAKLNEEKIVNIAAKWFEENVVNDGDLDFLDKLNTLIDEVAAIARM